MDSAYWWGDIHDCLVNIHQLSKDAGWWPEKRTNELYGTKIALIHSEVSEMLEGLRKGLKDSHLKDRSAEEVEAADVFIRLLDYCGARELDLVGAVEEKLKYNQTRVDHKREARNAQGGKKF